MPIILAQMKLSEKKRDILSTFLPWSVHVYSFQSKKAQNLDEFHFEQFFQAGYNRLCAAEQGVSRTLIKSRR
jgi:hypothetical protein